MNDNKEKPQSVNWEAVRMLATEIGAREAARKLGINANTVLSRAKRENWRLPKRKGGKTIKSAIAIAPQSTPAEALIAHHKELEGVTKTGLMQTLAKAVQALAKKEALPVESIAQFKDACLAAAKLFGWDGEPRAEININNAIGVVCGEEQRRKLIALRHELQVMHPTPILPAPQTQPQTNIGAGNAIPAPTEEAIEKPRPLFSAPAGATAPSDASQTYRTWLEYQNQEQPEPDSGDPAGELLRLF